MRNIPFRTILFSGLVVLGFFSCKPTGGDSASSESATLDANAADGAQATDDAQALDGAPCPNPAQPDPKLQVQ
jgi:hypothetical protein